MKRRVAAAVLGVLCAVILWFATAGPSGDSPHKIYVMLGLHANFYHSWRGSW